MPDRGNVVRDLIMGRRARNRMSDESTARQVERGTYQLPLPSVKGKNERSGMGKGVVKKRRTRHHCQQLRNDIEALV